MRPRSAAVPDSFPSRVPLSHPARNLGAGRRSVSAYVIAGPGEEARTVSGAQSARARPVGSIGTGSVFGLLVGDDPDSRPRVDPVGTAGTLADSPTRALLVKESGSRSPPRIGCVEGTHVDADRREKPRFGGPEALATPSIPPPQTATAKHLRVKIAGGHHLKFVKRRLGYRVSHS